MARPNSTPVYRDGQRLRIAGMAASSIAHNLYDVSTCDECGSHVAWAQGKSGGWYLCKTMEYNTEGGRERFRAAPWIRHDCSEVAYQVWGPEDFFAQAEFASEQEARDYIDDLAEANRRSGADTLSWIETEDLEPDVAERLEQVAQDSLIRSVKIRNEYKINEARKVK